MGTVTSSGGVFTVTDASGKSRQVDLGTLMMMLNLDRTENLDKQIAIQLDEIQKRNGTIKTLTEVLAKCRSLKAAGSNDDYQDANGGWHGQSLTINGVAKPIWTSTSDAAGSSWADELGISWNTGNEVNGGRPSDKDGASKWDAQWDAKINEIKGKIDMLNNDSQMDNIKLQNLLEKRGNAFEMATKVMDT
ncbi:MAG: hypothetical protein LBE84_12355, partial [Planctomycetota bacterium]|nr:hypothetical protein [Planctomycetota bacterium]